VELFFRKSDATVVIEAPARFRIEDAKTLRMESGRLSAVVRNGKQGLRVLTPHTEVLDLGTRFAVDATQTSRSEVHVFEGKVQAGSVAHASQSHLLEASGALRFDGAPQPMPCDLREAAFVQSEELIPLAAALRARQDERATQAFKRLQADPALLAATNFEKTENDKLLTVNGPRRVQGRFPGRHALDFVDSNDHVKLNLNVRVPKFTFMTWVRLNSELTASDYSSLYHTDGWHTPGQVHWMIRSGGGFLGRMRFAIHGGPVEGARNAALWAVSRDTLLDKLKRWTHLALVYDSEARQVTFYIDGRFDSVVAMPKSLPAVLGPAEIGNWDPLPDRERRRLCGRMDELLVFSRAFSATEVHTYYQESSPYQ